MNNDCKKWLLTISGRNNANSRQRSERNGSKKTLIITTAVQSCDHWVAPQHHCVVLLRYLSKMTGGENWCCASLPHYFESPVGGSTTGFQWIIKLIPTSWLRTRVQRFGLGLLADRLGRMLIQQWTMLIWKLRPWRKTAKQQTDSCHLLSVGVQCSCSQMSCAYTCALYPEYSLMQGVHCVFNIFFFGGGEAPHGINCRGLLLSCSLKLCGHSTNRFELCFGYG